jgi:hypothetical protein
MQVLRHVLDVIGGVTLVVGSIAAFFKDLILEYIKERWKSKGDIEADKAKALNAIQRIQPEQYVRRQFEVYVDLLPKIPFAISFASTRTKRSYCKSKR